MARSPLVSVIVPCLDEEHHLEHCLRRAATGRNVELVVVDGGSRDRSVQIARTFTSLVITSERGRARQMNAGAAVARGESLIFLHADTLLPAGFEAVVRQVLALPRTAAGAFRLRIDGPGAALRLIERGVNTRSERLGLPYGDQAIFLRADLFHRLGGYADLPIMEDLDLVQRLRAMGRIRIARTAVLTSARSWLTHGVLRVWLVNQACIGAHMAGVSVERIAAWRCRVLAPQREQALRSLPVGERRLPAEIALASPAVRE